jgi:TonB-linked SusC/RagA family outer membrane protein
MKKIPFLWAWDNHALTKTLRIMRIFTFLMLVGVFQVYAATSYSQTAKVSLNLNGSSVVDVLDKIEESSEFFFLYNEKLIDINRTVDIKVKEKPINEVLDIVFQGEDVDYQLVDRKIILSPGYMNEPVGQQDKKLVSGKVTDVTGEVLPGVSIVIKGTTIGTITNIEGVFSMEIPSSTEFLQLSFIGMKTLELDVKGKTEFNVVLKDDFSNLEEVVVVGYGTQKKTNVSGAISQVGSEVFEDRATPNIGTALQGVIPNFNIDIASGSPDEDVSYNVRGVESLNSTDPLILVDGIPYDDLSDFSPDDIKSVTVLKDAASAAIYGARAAFGVILVTTKMGTKSSKVKVKYSFSQTFSSVLYLPNSLNSVESAEACNLAKENGGASAKYTDEFIAYCQAYIDDPTADNSWYKEDDGDYVTCANVDVYGEAYSDFAVSSNHNLSFSGGGDVSTFYVSLGYSKDEGQWKVNPDVKKRYTTMFKYNYDVNDWLTTGFNITYNESEYDQPHAYDGLGGYFHAVERSKPWQLILTPEGFPEGEGLYMNHTLTYQRYGGRDVENTQLTSLSGNFILKPIKNVVVNGTFTRKNYTTQNKNNASKILMITDDTPYTTLYYGSSASDYVQETTSQSSKNIIDIYSSYTNSYGKNNVKAMLGYSQTTYDYSYSSIKASGLYIQDITSVELTDGDVTVSDAENETAIRGAFARLNYNYDEKYIAEFDGRYDGSYVFPEDNRFGFFPSASVAWVVSKEDFFDAVPVINRLKLRASYGSLGNQDVDEDLYVSTMSYSTLSSYLIDGDYPTKVSVAGLISDDLTWETARTANVGVDMGLFNNRLDMSLDVYSRITSDMVVDGEDLPATLGTDAPQTNAATMKTTGFELSIGWKQKLDNGFSYSISGSLSNNKSVITDYDLNSTNSLSDYYEGYEFGEIWGYETEGLFNSDEELEEMEDQSDIKSTTYELGDVNYKDIDGDGVITDGSSTVDDPGDRKIIGNGYAKYKYGISLSAQYKGFDFSAFFRGVGKKDVYFNTSAAWFWGHSGVKNSQYSTGNHWALDNAWSTDNTDAYLPIYKYNSDYNMETQTRYLQNGAYLRLKSMIIGYNLPKSLIQKVRLDKVRVYISGENLWTHDHLHGLYDPEVLGNTSSTTGKVYPNSRSYAFGVQITL